MFNVRVPIDLGTVASTQCSAFALVTPMRVRDLLALVVAEALGKRAPIDRRERGLCTTVDGLRAGKFAVDIDGRIYTDPDACVVCQSQVTLRFFSQHDSRVSHGE